MGRPGTAGLLRFLKEARAEPPLSRFIPWSSLVSSHDVLTRAGDWMRIWRLGGVAFECADENWIRERHEAKASLLRNLGGGQFAVWEHRVHRRMVDALTPPKAGFAAALDRAYTARLAEKPFMSNELYLTIVYRPNAGLAKLRRTAHTIADVARAHREARTAMEERTALVERTLREFEPELLMRTRVYRSGGGSKSGLTIFGTHGTRAGMKTMGSSPI